MKDNVFIDTNIFIYAKLEKPDEQKHVLAKAFLSNIKGNVIISIQVINEFYNVCSKNKIADTIIQDTISELLEDVNLIPLNLLIVKTAWEIRRKYKYNYYDCLIIAAALEGNCKILYSEDLQHNQLIDKKLTILNPFV